MTACVDPVAGDELVLRQASIVTLVLSLLLLASSFKTLIAESQNE